MQILAFFIIMSIVVTINTMILGLPIYFLAPIFGLKITFFQSITAGFVLSMFVHPLKVQMRE